MESGGQGIGDQGAGQSARAACLGRGAVLC